MDIHTFNSDGLKLNVARAGDMTAPPLIMLHGATGSYEGWLPVIPELLKSHYVIAPDLPGHGASGHHPKSYPVSAMANHIADLIQQLGLSHFHLLGFSYGGHVALKLTETFGNRIDRLILQDIPLVTIDNRIEPRPAGESFPIARKLIRTHGQTIDLLTPAIRETEPDIHADALELKARNLAQLDPLFLDQYIDQSAMQGYAPHALLSHLSMPTLLMRADPEYGARISPLEGKVASALNSGIKDTQIDRAGHTIHIDQPEPFLDAVHTFLP